jgi:hypothetical protein
MDRLRMFVGPVLLLPALAAAQSQARPVVIRASTVLDGKGGVLRDVALVIQGTKIVRIDSNPSEATYDLRTLHGSNLSRIRSARKCYPCLRNELLLMCPEWT